MEKAYSCNQQNSSGGTKIFIQNVKKKEDKSCFFFQMDFLFKVEEMMILNITKIKL